MKKKFTLVITLFNFTFLDLNAGINGDSLKIHQDCPYERLQKLAEAEFEREFMSISGAKKKVRMPRKKSALFFMNRKRKQLTILKNHREGNVSRCFTR